MEELERAGYFEKLGKVEAGLTNLAEIQKRQNGDVRETKESLAKLDEKLDCFKQDVDRRFGESIKATNRLLFTVIGFLLVALIDLLKNYQF